MPAEDAFEKHYRISELSELWGIGRETLRLIFSGEPGVVKNPHGPQGKKYELQHSGERCRSGAFTVTESRQIIIGREQLSVSGFTFRQRRVAKPS